MALEEIAKINEYITNTKTDILQTLHSVSSQFYKCNISFIIFNITFIDMF